MDDMGIPTAKAYIAPDSTDMPIRSSGHVEQSGGSFQFSPVFYSLSEAAAWARDRTDVVVARGASGGYVW